MKHDPSYHRMNALNMRPKMMIVNLSECPVFVGVFVAVEDNRCSVVDDDYAHDGCHCGNADDDEILS